MSQAVSRSADRVLRESRTGIVYGDRGNGRAVLLLHGWCLNRDLWLYLEERLIQGYRVISPDLPGFGGSRGLAGPYSLERFAEEISSLLDELQLESVVLIGFAFGAAVAMTLAAGGDARLARLILIGVPSAQHSPYQRMPRAMRRDWPEFARLSATAICRQPQSQATLDWLSNMFRTTPLPVALETVDVLSQFEPQDLARQVSIRTLFVHGADDDVVPPSVSAACAAHMRAASVVTVADSGHLVVVDQKEQLATVAEQFLRAFE